MTNQNCPKCESSRTSYQENYGHWECQDCGHTWGFDEDDPDYEEFLDSYPDFVEPIKND